jgi:aminoglycoside 6'-N-acetyltransferase
MDEELVVPLRSWQPGVYDADRRPTPVEGSIDDLAEDTAVDRRVPDDTAPADLVLAGLELRLDEHDGVPARLEQPQHRRQGDPDADEGDVRDEQVGPERQLGELARVRPLHHGDARVAAELRMQLPVAHVDRDHARDAVLEQVVREAAGRGSDVDGVASVQLELELLEGVRELLAATRDEARRPLHVKVDVLGDLVPGLVVAGDETGQDERLRLCAALGEPALHEHDVEALPHRGKGSHGWCNKNGMELQGDRVVLRPLADSDVPAVVELGADPEVERWWRGLTPEHVLAKARGEDDGTKAFAIVVDSDVAGMIQHYEETDEEFRHAGIDLFLGRPYQDQGLGADAVRTMARHLLDDVGHHRLVIDPAAHNERAIRCYEKVGFKRVGVLRQYWLDGDGVWRDGLLLDLLAGELT